jgi:Na+/proline symporter
VYGPPPGYGWYPLPPPAWPDGPGRPNLATTAAVLGYVTAGLTFFASLASVLAAVDGDEVALMLTLGLPCAAGLVAGGVRLHDRRSPALLFGSAVACVAVLLLAWVTGALTIDRTDGLQGLTTFVLLAMILPALTAAFSWTRNVREWAAARPD